MSDIVFDRPEQALAWLSSLQAQGAARWNAVAWHYIETLAERTRTQSGEAQRLLSHKLHQALDRYQAEMHAASCRAADNKPASGPSPLGALLGDMTRQNPPAMAGKPAAWRAENPRIQQFRQQLRKISVQKQVNQAIAQAPQNAGPINSHMLVLRSLGLMRDLSPDYLNRFMTHVDTLLCLEEAGQAKPASRKTPGVSKGKKSND